MRGCSAHTWWSARWGTSDFFYVVGVRDESVCLLQVSGAAPVVHFPTSVADGGMALQSVATVTSMQQLWCYDYQLAINFSATDTPKVGCDLLEAHSMLKYCCLNFIERLKVADLKEICGAHELGKSGTHAELVERIVDSEGVTESERNAILSRLRRVAERRSGKSKHNNAEEFEEEDERQLDDVEVAAGRPAVAHLPEGEVAFALGKLAAGMALAEEEEDHALEVMAAAALEKATPAKHVVPEVDSAKLEVKSGAASSSTCAPSAAMPLAGPTGDGAMGASAAGGAEHPSKKARAFLGRSPRLDEMVAPAGCSCRCYDLPSRPGWLFWEAKVPKDWGRFEGTKSKSSSFAADPAISAAGRSLAAKTVCHSWLERFAASRCG